MIYLNCLKLFKYFIKLKIGIDKDNVATLEIQFSKPTSKYLKEFGNVFKVKNIIIN